MASLPPCRIFSNPLLYALRLSSFERLRPALERAAQVAKTRLHSATCAGNDPHCLHHVNKTMYEHVTAHTAKSSLTASFSTHALCPNSQQQHFHLSESKTSGTLTLWFATARLFSNLHTCQSNFLGGGVPDRFEAPMRCFTCPIHAVQHKAIVPEGCLLLWQGRSHSDRFAACLQGRRKRLIAATATRLPPLCIRRG